MRLVWSAVSALVVFVLWLNLEAVLVANGADQLLLKIGTHWPTLVIVLTHPFVLGTALVAGGAFLGWWARSLSTRTGKAARLRELGRRCQRLARELKRYQNPLDGEFWAGTDVSAINAAISAIGVELASYGFHMPRIAQQRPDAEKTHSVCYYLHMIGAQLAAGNFQAARQMSAGMPAVLNKPLAEQ